MSKCELVAFYVPIDSVRIGFLMYINSFGYRFAYVPRRKVACLKPKSSRLTPVLSDVRPQGGAI